MGKSCEMLRDDLRAVHSALGEVLSCAQPDAPSWRFPEKLSASVTLDDLLEARGADEDGKGGRVLLLEGMVDRYICFPSFWLYYEPSQDQVCSTPLGCCCCCRAVSSCGTRRTAGAPTIFRSPSLLPSGSTAGNYCMVQ